MLKSERGQMAIFIALIFQVLFVFFAMIVNVGLIVHDKINLQNSVDIAAYYAAQRQAELLNAIAHQNYQIRQAWKLLAWRLRVIGDLGYKQHPMQKNYGGTIQDVSAFAPGNADGSGGSTWRPTVCVSHTLWGNNQNICYDSNINIPPMPPGRVIMPIGILGAINVLTALQIDKLKDSASADCEQTGPMNFNLAISWISAYRFQVAQSKELIRRYADMLSASSSEFNDLSNLSVAAGTHKTLTNNLTRANYKSLDKENFRMFNSLGALGDRKKWLNEVPIYPLVFYTDFRKSGGACIGTSKPINGRKSDGARSNIPAHYPGGTISNDIEALRNEPMDPYDLYHSTFGVEKNPWAMAYVGVYAETKPRKPYLPFGEPITLRAKAFAKPFGGRIGPWFFKKWPMNATRSIGNAGDKVDGLMPLPMDITGASMGPQNEQELAVPNYSRFPGDQIGLLSKLALSAFKQKITQKFQARDPLSSAFYSGTPNGADGLAAVSPVNQQNASQMLLQLGYRGPWIRDFEVAAITPDLFDATYYSVDRDSFKNYTEKAIRGNIINESEAPLDIGSLGIALRKNIDDQIILANNLGAQTFWTIKSPAHLLTAWAPSGAFKYDFPSEVFGKCFDGQPSSQPVPGMCPRGGRVGYSVKIVSEDYLNSDQLALGGDNSKGKIINPPPSSF